jgi:hypothetical protein
MASSLAPRFALALIFAAAGCGGGNGTGGTSTSGGGGASSATTADSTTGAGGSGGSGGSGGATATASSSASTAASSTSTGSGGPGDPPFGGSSGGSGGPAPVNGATEQAGGVTYRLIVPASYKPGMPAPFLLVYSGTEGGQAMTQNLIGVGPSSGTSGFLRAVLDGVQYNGNGAAGATVLDDVRAKYDVDNDRTYLLGESAGTSAAEKLGFTLRQSYFAAYWANDVNQAATPGQDAAMLGFQPWGQAGPGGAQAIAQQIIAGMMAAGYRLPNPAPYAGPGADMHGSPQQFIAAMSWFPGKTRK